MYANPIVLRDLTLPMATRLTEHKARHSSPYYLGPLSGTKPVDGWGGYLSKGDVLSDGCSFTLRVERAQGILRVEGYERTARTKGYYSDAEGCGDPWIPYVVRLNHGRGFLAATGLGEGMCFSIDAGIHDSATEAALDAYQFAERTAEEDAEFQAKDREEWEAEERADAFAEASELPEDLREN